MAEEEVLGVTGPSLDVSAALSPGLAPPFGEHCARGASTCQALYDGREVLYSKLGHFLFGAEASFDRLSNDIGAAVRRSFASLGVADWAVSLMGDAPERPGQHSRLLLQRQSGKKAEVSLQHFHDAAQGSRGPEKVNPSELASYDDLRLSLQHLTIDVAGTDAAGTPVACSDLTATAAIGADACHVTRLIDQAWRFSKVLAWLAAPDGHPTKLKVGMLDRFQRSTDVGRRFVDMQGVRWTKRQLSHETVQVTLTLPFNLEEAAKHYPRTAELLALLSPVQCTVRRTGAEATLATLSYKDSILEVSAFFREGRQAFREPAAGFVEWDEAGRFSCDATLDIVLVPLGISAAAVPLPRMTMRCELDRAGKAVVTCAEAGEPAFPAAAAAVMDNDLLRKLLHDAFRIELEHLPDAGCGRSMLKAFGRLVFPSSTVATLISQWFQGFALQQFCELDVMQAVADLLGALAEDAGHAADGSASPL